MLSQGDIEIVGSGGAEDEVGGRLVKGCSLPRGPAVASGPYFLGRGRVGRPGAEWAFGLEDALQALTRRGLPLGLEWWRVVWWLGRREVLGPAWRGMNNLGGRGLRCRGVGGKWTERR